MLILLLFLFSKRKPHSFQSQDTFQIFNLDKLYKHDCNIDLMHISFWWQVTRDHGIFVSRVILNMITPVLWFSANMYWTTFINNDKSSSFSVLRIYVLCYNARQNRVILLYLPQAIVLVGLLILLIYC